MPSSESGASAVVVSRGVSYLTIQTVITTLAQVLSFSILTRIITPSEVGVLAILSLITTLSQAINGGAFSQASMKYIGEYAGTNEALAAGVFYQTFRVSMVISLPISGFIFLESGFLAGRLLGAVSQAQLFRIVAVDVLVFAGMLPVANGAVLGAKRFKESAEIGTAGAVLRQCLIILLILFLKSFVGLVYAWVLSDLAMLGGYGLYGIRVLGLTRNPFPLRKLMTFSWPLTIGSLVGFAYSSFDRAILIGLVPLASLGIYNAVLYAYGVLVSITGSFGSVLLPVYSGIVGRGAEACRRATWVASRYLSLVMAPLGFGLFAMANPALSVFVGRAYVAGAVPLMILSLPVALTAFSLGLGPMLTALAKTRAVMLITVSSTVLALISAYVLLPFLGIAGAAAARDIAGFASLGLTIYVLKRNHAMSIDVETAWKSLAAGVVMAGAVIVMQTVVYSRLVLPVHIILGAFLYMILLRFLRAVKRHDIELIDRYLGSRLGFLTRLLSSILIG